VQIPSVGGPEGAADLNDLPTTPDRRLDKVERDAFEMPAKTKTHRDPRREELRRLGERIREERRGRGMTQETLAEALDLSVAYVSLIERGGRNPPYTTVVAIARALGIPTANMVAD
jgi:ribosome-binding protein aMBF1 (putative translation factor)